MEHLHAYWRMEYIKAPQADKSQKRTFAEMLAMDASEDRGNLILERRKLSFLILNKFPYNAGHLMVMPNRAVPLLTLLSAEERGDLMETMVLGQELLTRALKPDGFNVGFNFGSAAGAGIPQHLHGHIVPRWNGDTNFMPVIGETRVLPESLDRMWKTLKDALIRSE